MKMEYGKGKQSIFSQENKKDQKIILEPACENTVWSTL